MCMVVVNDVHKEMPIHKPRISLRVCIVCPPCRNHRCKRDTVELPMASTRNQQAPRNECSSSDLASSPQGQGRDTSPP